MLKNLKVIIPLIIAMLAVFGFSASGYEGSLESGSIFNFCTIVSENGQP